MESHPAQKPASGLRRRQPSSRKTMMTYFATTGSPGEVTGDAAALPGVRATPPADDIEVFYIFSFSSSTTAAMAFPPSYCPNSSHCQNNIIISSSDKRSFTLAHELGHLLLNDGEHYGSPSDSENMNLMKGGSIYSDIITALKRLLNPQRSVILKSPLAK